MRGGHTSPPPQTANVLWGVGGCVGCGRMRSGAVWGVQAQTALRPQMWSECGLGCGLWSGMWSGVWSGVVWCGLGCRPPGPHAHL